MSQVLKRTNLCESNSGHQSESTTTQKTHSNMIHVDVLGTYFQEYAERIADMSMHSQLLQPMIENHGYENAALRNLEVLLPYHTCPKLTRWRLI